MADRQENKKTVVVVDDEPIIRMDLGQMLEELNYEVVAEGADGFDAVELCRKKNPDVVLLDLEMPVFDGMTAAETIINENLGAEQYGIAFRSGDQELCDQIQGAIDQLVENGTYQKIADKYPDIVNNLIFLNK